jgi:hypothetical protein
MRSSSGCAQIVRRVSVSQGCAPGEGGTTTGGAADGGAAGGVAVEGGRGLELVVGTAVAVGVAEEATPDAAAPIGQTPKALDTTIDAPTSRTTASTATRTPAPTRAARKVGRSARVIGDPPGVACADANSVVDSRRS